MIAIKLQPGARIACERCGVLYPAEEIEDGICVDCTLQSATNKIPEIDPLTGDVAIVLERQERQRRRASREPVILREGGTYHG